MNKAEILKVLNEIFREVFDDDTLVITEETSAEDVDDWDSYEQINLLMACERRFGMRFEMEEASLITNVRDMIAIIEKKIS